MFSNDSSFFKKTEYGKQFYFETLCTLLNSRSVILKKKPVVCKIKTFSLASLRASLLQLELSSQFVFIVSDSLPS